MTGGSGTPLSSVVISGSSYMVEWRAWVELGIPVDLTAAEVGLWRRARAEGLRSCRSYWVARRQKPSISTALKWSLLGLTFALCTWPGV
jgi:hypothetical protein